MSSNKCILREFRLWMELLRLHPTLCANMTETLAPLFIRVEGQEGISHGEDHGQ
jgi:hypothetical protein